MIQELFAELLFLFGVFVFGGLLGGGTLLFRAKYIDPRPLFPLVVAVLTLSVGLRISQTWFFLTLEIPTENPFNHIRDYKPAFDMAVWRPLGMIMGGLWIHCVVYAFAELRHSWKQERLTVSTRVVFHSTLACMLLAMVMHVRVFDASALRGLGKWEAFQNQQPLRVWDAAEPGRPLFDMWFTEDAVDWVDW